MPITRNINDDNTLAYLFNKKAADIIYPVGSIYMSVNSTSPEKLFGGKWERITGRFLLAATDGGATNTNANASQAPGSMAGEAAHTLVESEMPSHVHRMACNWTSGGGSSKTEGEPWAVDMTSGTGDGIGTWPFGSDSGSTRFGWTGGSGAHNNMPPFLAVYMWKRTA